MIAFHAGPFELINYRDEIRSGPHTASPTLWRFNDNLRCRIYGFEISQITRKPRDVRKIKLSLHRFEILLTFGLQLLSLRVPKRQRDASACIPAQPPPLIADSSKGKG